LVNQKGRFLLSMSKAKQQLGFSLVELMIVVVIISLLFGLAIPSYKEWIQNTKIRTAAESIQNGIQKARSEALMRNTFVEFNLGANSAWTVKCADITKCTDLKDSGGTVTGVVEQRQSGDGSSIDIVIAPTPPTATNITFNQLGLKTATATNALASQLTQVGVDMSTTVISNAASRELSVTIGAGGNVRVCDPNASASDPRHC
jgi:type IV fimbrial biogenesis protein FimT